MLVFLMCVPRCLICFVLLKYLALIHLHVRPKLTQYPKQHNNTTIQQYNNYQQARQDINGRPVRMDTLSDIREAFSLALESHGQEAEASLDQKGVQILANMLEHPLDEEALEVCMSKAKGAGVSGGAGGSKGGGGGRRITLEEFADFWNSEECNPNLSDLKRDMQIGSKRKLEGSGAVFS